MKHRSLLIVLVLFALLTLSCGLSGGLSEEEAADGGEPIAQTGGEEPVPPTETPALPQAEEPRIRAVDGMVVHHVPAGEFLMGDDGSAFKPEKPGHLVYLDDYWMDQTEITNAQYRRCVDAGACAAPPAWNNPDLSADDQPALVPWSSAQAYCQWVGGQLPTEAQWEKAARGIDGRLWPWGSQFEEGRANLSGNSDGYGATAPVGSFLNGASPYGLLDMAGNAAEWVADWYDAEYYAQSPVRNPVGPTSGEDKVVRSTIANGGGGPEKCRTVARYPAPPEHASWHYGFRCVAAQPPEASGGQPAAVAEEAAGSGEQLAPTTEPAANDQQPADDQQAPTAAPEAAGGSGLMAAGGGLTSYRVHGIERVEGGDQTQFDITWVMDPPAAQMTMAVEGKGGMEMIAVDNTLWTRITGIGDGSWRQVTISEEEAADLAAMAQQAQGEAGPLDYEGPQWPAEIESVPGQLDLPIVEGSLSPAGAETVNGVQCQRYNLNSDYTSTYRMVLPEPTGETRFTTHTQAQGEVWVADQGDLPRIIIRARVQMVETTQTEGNVSQTTTESTTVEYDVTDINAPIIIEAPQ